MGIVSVSLQEERFSSSRDGSESGTRVYRVIVDDAGTDAADAMSASAIPDHGDAWNGSKSAVVTDIESEMLRDDNEGFDVRVTYTHEVEDDGTGGALPTSPLDRPNVYRITGQKVTEPYFRDVDDEPVVNSAGEEFADLPVRHRTYGILEITRTTSSNNASQAKARLDTINSGSVSIDGVSYPAGTLRCDRYDIAGPFTENDVTYYEETIQLAMKKDTWIDVFEDRGLNELDGGELKPIVDAEDNPVRMPYPLNGSGGAAGSPTTAPATITRKPYEEIPFSWAST